MKIRKSAETDLPVLVELLEEAKQTIAALGIDQWQAGYPNEAVIREDIRCGCSYCVLWDQKICGTFVLVEHEPTYDRIYDGHWLTGDDRHAYITIHRIAVAVAKRGQGVCDVIMDFVSREAASRGLASIRVDTHPGNRVMRRMLEKQDFLHCGTIHLTDGSPRVAYEKTVCR